MFSRNRIVKGITVTVLSIAMAASSLFAFAEEQTKGEPDSNTMAQRVGLEPVALTKEATGFLKVQKNSSKEATVARNGDLALGISFVSGAPAGTTYKSPKFTVLLPKGVGFVAGSSRLNGVGITPEIFSNYKETGRTALVFDTKKDYSTPGLSPNIRFKVFFNRQAQEGINNFDIYVTTPSEGGNPIEWEEGSRVQDIYDINGNGSTDDYIGYTQPSINFKAPEELIGRMTVEGTQGYSYYSDGVDVGGSVNYMITLKNNGPVAIKDVRAINVLPNINDKYLVTDGSGKYLDRGSKYRVYLTDPIGEPEGFEVLYSTETPGRNGEEINNQGFVPAHQVGDFTKVTMFKIVNNQGHELATMDQVQIKYTGKIEGENLQAGDKSFNSFIYAGDSGEFFETLAASGPIIRYQVKGLIFKDLNMNGTGDFPEEEGIKDREVVLVNMDTGEEVSGKTNRDGQFLLTTDKRGSYKVILKKNDLETLSPLKTGPGVVNQFVEPGCETDVFVLDPLSPAVERNGSIYDTGTIKIERTNEEGQPLEGLVFRLVDTVSGAVRTLKTNSDGVAFDLGLILHRDYTLTQITVPVGYNLSTEEVTITPTSTNPQVLLSGRDSRIKGTLVYSVRDREDNLIRLPGVKIKVEPIDGEGNGAGAPIDIETNSEGIGEVKNLPYGDYRIKQVATKEGYVLDQREIEFRIGVNGETVTKKVEAERIKGSLIVTVSDKDNSNIKIEGATVEITRIPKGSMIFEEPLEGVTDINGQAVFENLIYGQYKVSQIRTVEGYQMEGIDKEVSIETNGQTQAVAFENMKIQKPLLPENPQSPPTTENQPDPTPGSLGKVEPGQSPKTGDEARSLMVGGLMAISLGAIIFLRKNKNPGL